MLAREARSAQPDRDEYGWITLKKIQITQRGRLKSPALDFWQISLAGRQSGIVYIRTQCNR